jgi:DNA invertase Pin-like site-specific DNA recombinase
MDSNRTSAGLVMGYARVSTLEQDESLQRDALTAAGCERIFVDKASGKLASRPALDRMLEQVRPGDTVVIWRLDRLGRSLRHLIDIFADLDERGVAVRSLTENLDTSTPGGRLVFHVFGALAEFERDLIRERTLARLAAARARGRRSPDRLDAGEAAHGRSHAPQRRARRGRHRPGLGGQPCVGLPRPVEGPGDPVKRARRAIPSARSSDRGCGRRTSDRTEP